LLKQNNTKNSWTKNTIYFQNNKVLSERAKKEKAQKI
jgi:hypothetical protein